jgi:hypothetical protein
MNKRLFVVALTLLALTSINARRANAQSCPNLETFGVRPAQPVNKSLQSQIEVTYFNTNDPNVFMSEKAGITRSASYMRLDSNQFVAKIDALVRDGVANIRKQQSATSYLGETAELNLERDSNNANARMVKAGLGSSSLEYLSGLDRETEISVSKGSSIDGDYYRLSMLSWFVDVSAQGGQKVVDYDASVLLRPGETAVFKLRGDHELKRNGAARSYIAVTMRSVNNVSLASLGRSHTTVASR